MADGTSGNDTLTGTDSDDIINGLGGVDTFSIGPGVTTLINVTTNQ